MNAIALHSYVQDVRYKSAATHSKVRPRMLRVA